MMNTYKCQREPIRVHGLYSTLKKRKEKLTDCCTRYKASKRNDVGNDPQLRFGSASASLFFLFFSSSPFVCLPL